MIRIGSLFSGIGGLELGIEVALRSLGYSPRVAWQVERDEFCRRVLAKHWPETDRSVIDVRADAALHLASVDVLVGGPPCQDISGAGKQEGLHGERSGLLFRYLQIVRALRPRIVVAENVRSGRWRDWLGVASCGLRTLGYRVEAIEAHAADVGAPHRRARIFVVAYADSRRQQGERLRGLLDGERAASGHDVDGCDGEAMAHPASVGRDEGQRGERCAGGRAQLVQRGYVADSIGNYLREQRERLPRGWAGELCAQGDTESRHDRPEGAAPQPGMGRGPDGLSAGLDFPRRWPAGRGEEQYPWEPPRTITAKEPHRRARLKALGNAVVPAVACAVMAMALEGFGEVLS